MHVALRPRLTNNGDTGITTCHLTQQLFTVTWLNSSGHARESSSGDGPRSRKFDRRPFLEVKEQWVSMLED